AGVEESGRVHLLIRALGDYTRELVARTTPGMHAEIYGPYGRFERRQAPREAWIAGGVGISPFVSWLGDPEAASFGGVTLFYFFTPGGNSRARKRFGRLPRRAARRSSRCLRTLRAPSSPGVSRGSRATAAAPTSRSASAGRAGCSTRFARACAAPASLKPTFATSFSSSAERGAAHCARHPPSTA